MSRISNPPGINKSLRPATYVIAASNANDTKNADYICTGTNDDVIIQAAINTLTNGGRILLSEGTFSIGTQISITASNISIEGQGNATILKQAASTNLSSLIYVNGTSTAINSIYLSNFLIDGNKAHNTFADGILFQTPGSENSWVLIENVTVQNCPNNGFRWNTAGGSASSSSYYLYKCWSKDNGGNGFFAEFNSGSSLTDSVFDSCISETNGNSGFYLATLDTHYVSCKSYFNGSGGGSTHGYYISGYNNYFTGCQAQDNYQSGFYLNNDGDATYGTQNNTFVNCDADSNNQATNGSYGCGWQINNTTGTTLTNCQSYARPYGFSWGQRIGVLLSGTTTGTRVVNLAGAGNSSALYSDTSSGTNYPLHNVGVASILSNDINVGTNKILLGNGGPYISGSGAVILIDGDANSIHFQNFSEIFLNGTNPNLSLFNASNNTLSIINGGGGTGNLSVQNKLSVQTVVVNGSISSAQVNKSGAYDLSATTDSVVFANASSAGFTLTLPDATTCEGIRYTIKKVDSSSNTVTVGTTSSQTIDGSTTIGLSMQYLSVDLISDGGNWNIV